MNKLSFQYIKSQFEHKDFFYRSKFIEEYDFEDAYLEYYKGFLLNYTKRTKNDIYLSDLINLACDLSIYEAVLIDRYTSILLSPNSALVKLSCVNYLLEAYYIGKMNNIEQVLKSALKSTKSEILKSELLVYLISISFSEDDFSNLKALLLKVNDWRTPIRLLRTLPNINISTEQKRCLIEILLETNAKKDYGSGFWKAFHDLPITLRLPYNQN